jgi:hypothetical protein
MSEADRVVQTDAIRSIRIVDEAPAGIDDSRTE